VTNVKVDGKKLPWLQTSLRWLPVAEEYWDLSRSCSIAQFRLSRSQFCGCTGVTRYAGHPKRRKAHRCMAAWRGTPQATTAVTKLGSSPAQKRSPNKKAQYALTQQLGTASKNSWFTKQSQIIKVPLQSTV